MVDLIEWVNDHNYDHQPKSWFVQFHPGPLISADHFFFQFFLDSFQIILGHIGQRTFQPFSYPPRLSLLRAPGVVVQKIGHWVWCWQRVHRTLALLWLRFFLTSQLFCVLPVSVAKRCLWWVLGRFKVARGECLLCVYSEQIHLQKKDGRKITAKYL